MSSLSDRLDFEQDLKNSSERRLEANRLTAVNTGIAGRTVLLPVGEAADYQRNTAAYIDGYQPVGLRECELVQTLSDIMWRLRRIHRLEMAIFAQGAVEFDGAFDENPAPLRPQMVELQTFLKYEKQLRNLQLQEARLQRRYEKDSAELRNLQKERARKEDEAACLSNLKNKKDNAAHSKEPNIHRVAASASAAAPETTSNLKNGFEFSTAAKARPGSDLSDINRHLNCT